MCSLFSSSLRGGHSHGGCSRRRDRCQCLHHHFRREWALSQAPPHQQVSTNLALVGSRAISRGWCSSGAQGEDPCVHRHIKWHGASVNQVSPSDLQPIFLSSPVGFCEKYRPLWISDFPRNLLAVPCFGRGHSGLRNLGLGPALPRGCHVTLAKSLCIQWPGFLV